MKAKIYWKRCPLFVVEDEDAVFIEASPEETRSTILPLLSPSEKLKFEQLKDAYQVKETGGNVHEGCFYFLVSRSVHAIKFESVALMTSDLAARGGEIAVLPDLPIVRIEDIDGIDGSKF